MSLKNPVKYPVKYYSWRDANAPQLTDADGVIKTILKACLVTGYGSKQGAGWTAPFEDDYRIVLRRPLRTGNPPDIKIENGVINSTASHRIVAQDNPASLDDANELSAANLLARDNYCGKEWHCIVTDFAFILCYQMGAAIPNVDKNHILFVGSTKKLLDNAADSFLVSKYEDISQSGQTWVYMKGITSSTGYNRSLLRDMRANVDYLTKNIILANVAELYFNNDYLAQKIIVDIVAELPFYCAIPTGFDNITTQQINIANRPMLRYVNKLVYHYSDNRALYIPLDYWEL